MNNLLKNNFTEELKEEVIKLWPKDFNKYEQIFNKCCFSIALRIFKELNLFNNTTETYDFDTISKKINLNPEAEYLLKRLLDILHEEGILKIQNNKYKFVFQDELEGPAELLVNLTRNFPEEGASFQWVARSYDGMLDFIKGKAYPEDIMFPWGDTDLVEDLYFTSPIYNFYSNLAGIAIKKNIDNLYQREVNILEIGAGTGNGTINVLNKTNNKFKKYTFTDISKTLLRKSKNKFNYEYMEFKILDINKNPLEQKFTENEYDIIFAVNVLHAINDTTKSIKYLHNLLKDKGCLIISEISPPKDNIYRYMELTFGLLPSYSTYKDKDVRPITPIIRLERWKDIFKNSGFKNIESIPDDTMDIDNRGGIVFGYK